MATPVRVVVGVDVGGTNTDAVVLTKVKGQGHCVLSEDKHLTTSDVTTGVRNAVLSVLRQARAAHGEIIVTQVNIGTTHFVNAVVQRKYLSRVSVIRLCGPASRAVPPFSDFPPSLKDVIFGSIHFVNGGYRVDGREIEAVDEGEISRVVEEIKGRGVKHIVVCGIFAPTRSDQEELVGRLINDLYPEATVTLSCTIGHIGLLERENAAIINETLKELCQKTVSGFRAALDEMGLGCSMFLTQNDGTVISEQQALQTPVFTFASGPTNSMRGAAFLCQLTDAIVVDIGGTTTDVGVLRNRFPREASTDVRVAGVRTNFRMPDVHSVGLGGGSYVTKSPDGRVHVGPLSAGFNLALEALIFGSREANQDQAASGRRLTASDVAVAAGLMELGDRGLVANLPPQDVQAALDRIRQIVEDAIDTVRVSDQPLPVILVGGGSKLLDPVTTKIRGVSEIILPEHFGVANAIGAALSQVSGNVDSVVVLERLLDDDVMQRRVRQVKEALPSDATQEELEEAVKAARKPFLEAARDQAVRDMGLKARQAAIRAGAHPDSLEIVDQEDVALSYLPGYATRIKVKAVGNLSDDVSGEKNGSSTPWEEPPGLEVTSSCAAPADVTKQTRSVTGQVLDPSEADSEVGVTWAGLTPTRPQVEEATGEWILNAWDIECIAVGAGILGAGGGGNPNIGRVRAREAVERGVKIRILSPDRLLAACDPDTDLLVSLAFMGAPVVLYEQTTSGQETPQAFRCLQELYSIGRYADGQLGNAEGVDIKEADGLVYIDDYQPRRPGPDAATAAAACDGDDDDDDTKGEQDAAGGQLRAAVGGCRVIGVLCAEVGGMNSLEPIMVSAILGLPVVDADGMGRAFPMLQMFLPFINGQPAYPTALADDKGRRAVILRSKNARQVEDHFRHVSMEMGSAAGLAVAPVTASNIRNNTVLRSFSRAWSIGDSILRARRDKANPLEALVEAENARVLLTGKVRDVTRETSGAFNRGRVHVEGAAYAGAGEGTRGDSQGKVAELLRLVLDFQNENLVVRRVDETGQNVETLAVVPDVISIVDCETAEPIPTEEVRYGQRVAVVVLPAPPPMTTPRALQVVGPAAFGYPDVEYRPVGQYKEPAPLAPS